MTTDPTGFPLKAWLAFGAALDAVAIGALVARAFVVNDATSAYPVFAGLMGAPWLIHAVMLPALLRLDPPLVALWSLVLTPVYFMGSLIVAVALGFVLFYVGATLSLAADGVLRGGGWGSPSAMVGLVTWLFPWAGGGAATGLLGWALRRWIVRSRVVASFQANVWGGFAAGFVMPVLFVAADAPVTSYMLSSERSGLPAALRIAIWFGGGVLALMPHLYLTGRDLARGAWVGLQPTWRPTGPSVSR